jgi:transcriptional regulator CtsR
MSDLQVRAVNYVVTDFNRNTFDAGYTIQTKLGDGPWTDIPIVTKYENQREEEDKAEAEAAILKKAQKDRILKFMFRQKWQNK